MQESQNIPLSRASYPQKQNTFDRYGITNIITISFQPALDSVPSCAHICSLEKERAFYDIPHMLYGFDRMNDQYASNQDTKIPRRSDRLSISTQLAKQLSSIPQISCFLPYEIVSFVVEYKSGPPFGSIVGTRHRIVKASSLASANPEIRNPGRLGIQEVSCEHPTTSSADSSICKHKYTCLGL